MIEIKNGNDLFYADGRTGRMVSSSGGIQSATWPNAHRFMPLADVRTVRPSSVPPAALAALRRKLAPVVKVDGPALT